MGLNFFAGPLHAAVGTTFLHATLVCAGAKEPCKAPRSARPNPGGFLLPPDIRTKVWFGDFVFVGLLWPIGNFLGRRARCYLCGLWSVLLGALPYPLGNFQKAATVRTRKSPDRHSPCTLCLSFARTLRASKPRRGILGFLLYREFALGGCLGRSTRRIFDGHAGCCTRRPLLLFRRHTEKASGLARSLEGSRHGALPLIGGKLGQLDRGTSFAYYTTSKQCKGVS